MPLARTGISHGLPQAFTLGTEHVLGTLGPVAPANAIANTTIQASLPLACNTKITKIMVSATALGDLASLFNLVVVATTNLNGAQAYVQGTIAPNDNSYTGPAYGANYSQTIIGTAAAGGTGFPTNIAGGPNVALPVALFAADVALNAANGFATTGGGGIFIPTNYDAVYAAGSVLTLRSATTLTGTAGLTVTVIGCIMGLRAGPVPGSTIYSAVPGQDF